MSGELPYDLRHGDCREVMAAMDAESIDAIVSDPPYGLGFMGKEWDHGVPGEPFWAEALRVAKPGAHLVAFGGSRTFHRLTCAVEDAGWEIRDVLMWVYGSGFPKSLDVSKAIDKEAGAVREVVGPRLMPDGRPVGDVRGRTKTDGWDRPWRSDPSAVAMNMMQTAPATDAARQWSGWGTALKPAYEPIILARKPLRGTVARNVQTYGTGAVNVDGCRVAGAKPATTRGAGGAHGAFSPIAAQGRIEDDGLGRWPANVLLDEAAAAVLDAQTGELTSGARAPGVRSGMGFNGASGDGGPGLAASVWGASRFFFVARSGSSTHNVEEQGGQPCGDGLTEAESTSAGKMEADRSDSLHIDGCGSKQTDLFQTGTKSTTSTKTRSTTDSKTSSVSPPSGMTTTTSGNEKTTGLSMESSNAGASDAGSTGRSETSAAEGPGRGRGIAPPASAITSESGAPPTESTTPPTCAPIESASSSRFFYTSKASGKDRGREEHGNDHPTVKPTDLMRWLCRLVTPPGGLILDPFMGSGSTGVAAVAEGFRFVGIDIERHHVDIAERRLKHAARQPAIFGLAS